MNLQRKQLRHRNMAFLYLQNRDFQFDPLAGKWHTEQWTVLTSKRKSLHSLYCLNNAWNALLSDMFINRRILIALQKKKTSVGRSNISYNEPIMDENGQEGLGKPSKWSKLVKKSSELSQNVPRCPKMSTSEFRRIIVRMDLLLLNVSVSTLEVSLVDRG